MVNCAPEDFIYLAIHISVFFEKYFTGSYFVMFAIEMSADHF
jgi:hypothetical protein